MPYIMASFQRLISKISNHFFFPPMAITARPRRHTLLRYIAVVLLTLIVLVGLSVLIIWLSVRPKQLIYTIENASVQNFTLSKNHLNATFDLVIRAYNPNSKVSLYYDYMEVSIVSSDQTLARGEVQPLFQPHRNATRLYLKLSSQSATLFDPVSNDLTLQKKYGKIELDIWIKAKIRFKVGVWKSRHRTLRVSCSPVTVQISKPKHFERTYCYVEL